MYYHHQGAQWYTVQYKPAISGSTWITAESNSKETSFNVTGLESGTAYYFQIIAVNDAGDSEPLVIDSPINTISSPGNDE